MKPQPLLNLLTYRFDLFFSRQLYANLRATTSASFLLQKVRCGPLYTLAGTSTNELFFWGRKNRTPGPALVVNENAIVEEDEGGERFGRDSNSGSSREMSVEAFFLSTN